jgi:uncharacterized alpha-E superfamily protein
MMLSRVADSLFWMSRYVERAENLARIIDVNAQLMLDLSMQQAHALSRNWLPVVACLGDEGAFRARHRTADRRAVTDFLVFDRSHPSSITGSLSLARENARTVREQITTEMWEQLNRTYLWLMSKGAHQFYERNNYEFFQRVKKSLQLFQGITDSVMVRGEGWEFIQMGKYLERGDKTTRLLDDEFFLLPADELRPADVIPQWISILRSCNARQAYQRSYATVVEPIQVAHLLLLNEAFPRSVVYCARQLDQSLRRISGVSAGRYSNLAEKLSGRLAAELRFSGIEEFWDRGMHVAIDDLQSKLNHLGQAILESYLQPSLSPPEPASRMIAQVPQ